MTLLLLKTSLKNKNKNLLRNNPTIYTFRNSSNYDMGDDGEDGWVVLGILGAVISLWWGFIHLIDAFTFNFIVWWVEPFTVLPVFAYLLMIEFTQRKNPIHWWPLVWGYKIQMVDNDRIPSHLIDEEILYKEYGGPLNVYVDGNCIKFRKQKDAVIYSLTKRYS